MPIYEYECEEKGHRFETMQKIGDKPLKKCTVCGGKAKKIISSSSFSLKGGGWYKDGYGSTTESKKSTTSSAPSKTSSSTSGTSKPKTEAK